MECELTQRHLLHTHVQSYLNLCSILNAILKFASLNSLLLIELPGPKLYAVHALLSLAPPAKKLLENGM